MGKKVTVYAECDDHISQDGVIYKHWSKINWKDTFNVLILWRSPHLLDREIKAKKIFMDLHDIASQLDWSEERMSKVAGVFFKSQYHRRMLPKLPEEKAIVLSNGISDEIFTSTMKEPKNRQYTVFYGSSYDRGLQHLLKIWSTVKAKHPKAELHVAYGWDLFDKGYANNPERMAWKERINNQMKQEGIIHHGRVSSEELHRLRLMSGVWAYPCHFQEINCITALEAQASGCVPVTIKDFALTETVQSGHSIEGDIYDEETLEAYTQALVSILGDKKRQEEERRKGKAFAQKYNWQDISKAWLAHIEKTT